MDFNEWLENQGLSKYANVFAENEIDEVEILAELSDAELESLGVPLGARKKISRSLSGGPQQPAAPAPAPAPAPAQSDYQPQQPVPAAPQQTPVAQQPTPAAPVQSPGIEQAANVAPSAAAPISSGVAHAAAPVAATRVQPKGKNSSKATAILIAVGVHVAIIVIATTLTIFAASKDEPEIIAMIAPSVATPQQEMKKKTVSKQMKQAPSAASAAAAPVAMMMKANAEAAFTAPDVTSTSTGPLGMGEGDLGTGAFGVGDGLGEGAGDGGSFFGISTTGELAVIFDITASMYKVVPGVVNEINKSFKESQVVAVFSGGFARRQATALVPYRKNNAVLGMVKSNSAKYKKTGIADGMNRALYRLKRCDSVQGGQSLGTALELMLKQQGSPGTVFVFSDFDNAADPAYMAELELLCRRKQAKVVFWNPVGGRWKTKNQFQAFVKVVGGEVKEQVLK